MKLSEYDLLAFTDRVSSDDPAPGGGSCAALAGALGAALAAMVGGMTQGRKKYAEFAEHAKETEESCRSLSARLLDVMDRDTDAFLAVSGAYGMPKDTEEEKAARSAAIQAALRGCTETPMEMMELCRDAILAAHGMLGRFNTNCASDLGVAVLLLKSGMQGAWMNVLINIGSLRDAEYAESARRKGEAILAESVSLADACYDELLKMIGG